MREAGAINAVVGVRAHDGIEDGPIVAVAREIGAGAEGDTLGPVDLLRGEVGEADALAVAIRAEAIGGVHAQVEQRVVDDPDERCSLVVQAEDHAEVRDAVREVLGAVHRIENPLEGRVRVHRGKLLPEDAVLRELRADHLPQSLLHRHIDAGDEALVGLALYAEPGALGGEDILACLIRKGEGVL